MMIKLCSSDEDTDVKSIVESWLKKQDESDRSSLADWIKDYFYKALEWVLKCVSSSKEL